MDKIGVYSKTPAANSKIMTTAQTIVTNSGSTASVSKAEADAKAKQGPGAAAAFMGGPGGILGALAGLGLKGLSTLSMLAMEAAAAALRIAAAIATALISILGEVIGKLLDMLGNYAPEEFLDAEGKPLSDKDRCAKVTADKGELIRKIITSKFHKTAIDATEDKKTIDAGLREFGIKPFTKNLSIHHKLNGRDFYVFLSVWIA